VSAAPRRDELARDLHPTAPARLPERDRSVLGVAIDPRARLEQPAGRLEAAALDQHDQHLVEQADRHPGGRAAVSAGEL
jgi:hypothetical protein